MNQTAQMGPGGRRTAHTFRMSWLRLYAVMAFGVTAIVLLPLAYLVLGGLPPEEVLSVVFAGLLFELAFAILLAACSPVDVGADGIRGFNFWGSRCTMPWDEMASATPSRFVGLRWLVVRSRRTRNALWLPLFLGDMRGFWETVARFAPPVSPLLSHGPFA